ncbi:MAG: branched-chain amino acid aminotransferase, partial [Planctomycetota bacterium]
RSSAFICGFICFLGDAIIMTDAKPDPGFGKIFTPHMLLQNYRNGVWETPKIVKYGPFKLNPATVVFHYGQEIFEGFKAYRQPDGSVCLFRPERNLARFNHSAERLCMATIDITSILAWITKLIKKDKEQIPERPHTLYIRPCMFGADQAVKVSPSSSYIFFTIISIVGDYFGGDNPLGVRLRTEIEYTRAASGGTGCAKCGGNYAASLAAQKQASKEGFDQVIWLDAREHQYVEEMGGMNIMFVLDDKLITPSLSGGTILPGITRDSLLQLAESKGCKTEERPISCAELIAAYRAGRLKEAFACGTAAVITPIREIVHCGEVLYKNTGDKPGELTMQLRRQLMDLQFGVAPDPFGWRYPIKL